MKMIALALAAAAAFALPAGAHAQPNPSASSLNGEVTLNTGFNPDPHVVSVRAGGTIPVSSVCRGGAGFVAENPDYKVTYNSGSLPLIISVASSADTTLLINGPDGQWYCDDDGGVNGSNPSIRFDHPGDGRYDIFVGTYRSGLSQAARLHISEVGSQ